MGLRPRAHRGSGLNVAAIWRVYTLALAAEILGETEDRLHDAGIDMPPEEGCLTVYGPGDAETMAFTEDGLENLKDYLREMRRSLSS